MGVNSLYQIGVAAPVAAIGSDLDQYITALSQDFVPRAAAGYPQARAGSMGTVTYPWGGAHINSISYLSETVIASHFQFKGQTMTGVSSMNTTFTAYSGCKVVHEGIGFKSNVMSELSKVQNNHYSFIAKSGKITPDGSNWVTLMTLDGSYKTCALHIYLTDMYSGSNGGAAIFYALAAPPASSVVTQIAVLGYTFQMQWSGDDLQFKFSDTTGTFPAVECTIVGLAGAATFNFAN